MDKVAATLQTTASSSHTVQIVPQLSSGAPPALVRMLRGSRIASAHFQEDSYGMRLCKESFTGGARLPGTKNTLYSFSIRWFILAYTDRRHNFLPANSTFQNGWYPCARYQCYQCIRQYLSHFAKWSVGEKAASSCFEQCSASSRMRNSRLGVAYNFPSGMPCSLRESMEPNLNSLHSGTVLDNGSPDGMLVFILLGKHEQPKRSKLF